MESNIPLRTDDGYHESTAGGDDDVEVHGYYKHRQYGCFWILLIMAAMAQFMGIVTYALFISMYENELCDIDVDNDNVETTVEYRCTPAYRMGVGGNFFYGLIFLCWGIATVWIETEDRGDHLMVTYGPWRWLLCGMGKEKILYRNIHHYSVSRSCFYGFGLPCCTSIKLFNSCSCCCGRHADLCGHKTIKLSIKERPQGWDATDDDNCCLEQCCLNTFCGDSGEYIGRGCCCRLICNPCNANFCIMNTVFLSTNDENGLLQLLNEKCQNENFV